jgi:hypothetical protein
MRKLVVAVLVVLPWLASCGESHRIKLAKHALEGMLKDPASVQYQDVKEYRDMTVCGRYNAKNAMGGYVGYTNFVWMGSDEHGSLFEKVGDHALPIMCK